MSNISLVYTNVIKMLGYRGVEVEKVLSEDEVISQLQNDKIIISGKRPDTSIHGAANIKCVILKAGSVYYSSGKFRSLVEPMIGALHTDIIIISETPLSSHVEKVIASFGDKKVRFESHSTELFMMEIPKHASVPRHVICDEAEIKYITEKYCFQKENLPQILSSDPPCVWLDVRRGMVVKIYRISETAGSSIAYRYCIR